MQYGMAMGSKMTPKGDKFGWLGKTGIVKDVSKTQEAKSQGHASPTSIQPDGHPNPAMVQKATAAPMNNERNPGKDTVASRTRGTTAKSANIEGNESPMYEKLEKKSLTSLKHGGSEKELREGHNQGGSLDSTGGTSGPGNVNVKTKLQAQAGATLPSDPMSTAARQKLTAGQAKGGGLTGTGSLAGKPANQAGSGMNLGARTSGTTTAPIAPKSGGSAGPVATSANAGYQGPRAPQPMAKEKKGGMKVPKLPKAPKTLREGHNVGAPGPKEKSMKLGGGGRFAKLKSEIAAKGKVKDPGAVAAAIGRKKYGAAKMAKMSAAGRKK